jgi:glycosyltransferase involved in cell wall biosynthesis
MTDNFEIIVVDDGSRDGTAVILEELTTTQPSLWLRVVTHPRNQGYGAALATGLDSARKELVFFTDGDKQFDLAELTDFIRELDAQTDMVIGRRDKRADPPMRLLNAFGWKLLVNGLFGYTASDVDCAFKLFRRSVWDSCTVRSRGATFSAEFLIKARRAGFRIKERRVTHYPRIAGRATGAKPSVILRAFAELVQLRWSLKRDVAEHSIPAGIAAKA